MGEREKLTAPPGGISLSQVNSPFSILRSQISGSKKPLVMASTNGGERFTVFPSRPLIALKANEGISFRQTGRASTPRTGRGTHNLPLAPLPNLCATGQTFLAIRDLNAS